MAQPISFGAGEIARCLPPPGRYHVKIEAVRRQPSCERPITVELRLRVLDRAAPLIHLYHRLDLRGATSAAGEGMRRLLLLLHLAGCRTTPDEVVDLECILGLELFVDVRRTLTADGFPFSEITSYHQVWRGESKDARNLGGMRATADTTREDTPCNQRLDPTVRETANSARMSGSSGALSRDHAGEVDRIA